MVTSGSDSTFGDEHYIQTTGSSSTNCKLIYLLYQIKVTNNSDNANLKKIEQILITVGLYCLQFHSSNIYIYVDWNHFVIKTSH